MKPGISSSGLLIEYFISMSAMKLIRLFKKSVRRRRVIKDKIEFDDFIKFSRNFFRFATFEFATRSSDKSFWDNAKIVLCDCFFWFSAFNVCLFVSLSAVAAIMKGLNMNAFTFSMPLLTSVSLVLVKCSTVYWNKSNISDVINQLQSVFPEEKLKQKKYNIKSYFENYRLFARVYAVMFMVPCVCVMIIPLIKLVSSGSKSFPLNIWVPFEYERKGIYIIAFLWSVWACANSVLILIAIDTLMFVLITLVSMEFDILRIDFTNLTATTLNIERQVGNFIQRHNNLIECNRKLEQIFSPSFLFNFVQSIFVICLTAFLYTKSSDPIQLIMNGSYCAAVLNQIFLICYFGQKVIDSTEKIAHASYNCGWESISCPKVRQAITNVIQRAQKPVKLTAMNFSDISLKSFTSVC